MLISEVSGLPEGLELMEWSEREFALTPPGERLRLLKKSDRMWVLEDGAKTLLVAGVLTPALVARPELWLLICRPFTRRLRRNLLRCRELVEDLLDLYPNVIVRVDASYPTAARFAAFMGFTQISYDVGHDGREYGIYEVN